MALVALVMPVVTVHVLVLVLALALALVLAAVAGWAVVFAAVAVEAVW